MAASLAAQRSLADPFVYVANIGSDDVTVIDAATNTAVATIPVGNDPDGIAVSPDGSQAFVTNFLSDDVSVIDTATQAVVGTVPVGSGPVGIAIAPDGVVAYVANKGSNTVTVLQTASAAVITTVPVGAGPNGIAITPDGRRAYVTDSFTSSPGTVSVIDTATNRVIETIAVQRSPGRVAITPDGELAYVTNWGSWTVSVIETATNAVADTVPAYGRPSNVVAHPNNGPAYVTGLGGRVQVIDTSDQMSTASIDVGQLPSGDSVQPYGAALTRDGARAFVANYAADAVAVVDLETNEVIAQVATGTRPFAVAVSCIGDACAAPPMTPRPTRTATPTMGPTHTPTPTFPATATRAATSTRAVTPTYTPQGPLVTLVAQAGRPDANNEVIVEVRLESAGHVVVGTQNDLVFDHSSVTLNDVADCELNPAVADTAPECAADEETHPCKTMPRSLATCNASPLCDAPPGDTYSRLRALILSFGPTVNNPIPDGLLYTCRFHVIDPTRLPTTVLVRNLFVSGVGGSSLGVQGRDTTIAIARAVDSVDAATHAPAGLGGGTCAIAAESGHAGALLLLPAVLIWRRRRSTV